MKKIICLLLIAMIAILPAVSALGDGALNPTLIEEYKNLLAGHTWTVSQGGQGTYLKDMSNKYSFKLSDYGKKWMLFATPSNDVYLCCRLDGYNAISPTGLIAFNEDGTCFIIYREGVGGCPYTRD